MIRNPEEARWPVVQAAFGTDLFLQKRKGPL